MAAELTFQPGRVPGLARRNSPSRRGMPIEAPGMSATQRAALTALIHTPIRQAAPRFSRADAGAGVAWIVVTACALAWTLMIAVELAPDLRIARPIEVPRVAQAAESRVRLDFPA